MSNEIVIDARGHMLGRLASIVAKELLNGSTVVVVRCEDINISGSLFRNKLKWESFRRKRMNTNPRKGPFHQRAPSRMFARTVRGMVPHKTTRGETAFKRLTTFEGVPHPYDKVKRVVAPDALKNFRLKPNRKFCRLGDLASLAGWKHNDLIERLESKRKVRSAAFYAKKKANNKIMAQARKNVAGKLAAEVKELESFGYSL